MMTVQAIAGACAGDAAGGAGTRPARVLVVAGGRAHRRRLASRVRDWGHDVTEADSAGRALETCRAGGADLVISDWVMPGMGGPDLCRALRALPAGNRIYFILLAPPGSGQSLAEGFAAGADDFLSGQAGAEELRARLHAGLRFVAMRAELAARTREAERALGELRRLCDSHDRDLIEAQRLQQRLLPAPQQDFGRARVAMMCRAAGRVGGDLVGCLRLDRRRIALYSVDVSGRDVAAAMMTARLAGCLAADCPGGVPAPRGRLRDSGGPEDARLDPVALAAALDRLMLDDPGLERYFTMVYAVLDLETGAVELVQAGHPHPLHLRADGSLGRIGGGGLPVGLVAGARYERVRLRLGPGERLILASDGVSECLSPEGRQFGEEAAMRLFAGLAALSGPAMLEAMARALAAHAGPAGLSDDVSALVLDFAGGAAPG